MLSRPTAATSRATSGVSTFPNPDPSLWSAAKIATLKDASNVAQPITSGVRIEIDQNNNVDRYLFVGTGKLLDQADLTDTSVTNTMYVIKDGNRTTPEPAPATPYSRAEPEPGDGDERQRILGYADGPRLVSGRSECEPEDQQRRVR